MDHGSRPDDKTQGLVSPHLGSVLSIHDRDIHFLAGMFEEKARDLCSTADALAEGYASEAGRERRQLGFSG